MRKVTPTSLLPSGLAVVLVAVVALFVALRPAPAAELTVTNLDDSGPGTLREAMNALTTSPGTNSITLSIIGTVTLASPLPQVTTSVDFIGPGPGLLIIDGDSSFRHFFVSGPAVTVSFSGLTLSNGFCDNSGGGAVLVSNGDPATTVSFTNCVFTDNSSQGNGGAVSALGSSTGGVLNFVDCTLRYNHASANGGGIDSPGAEIHLLRCALNNNAGYSGGAISVGAGSATILDCTISGNEASSDGGGINSNFAATYDIQCSTIVSNVAAATGGGLRTISEGPTFLENTIVAGNGVGGAGGPGPPSSGYDISGGIDSLGHNLVGHAEGASGFMASDLLGLDPVIGPLMDNGGPTLTHALLTNSPALNAGDASNVPVTDQRGFPRVVGTNVDIGAFEAQGTAPAIVCPSDKSTPNDPGQCSAIVIFAPTATGSPAPAVACNPPSESAFPVGTNNVICTASNSAGVATCSFKVIVRDSEAPVITCPAPIVASTDPGQCTSTNVVFSPTVTDNCGATNVCTPPSGSTFSNGVTTVTCVASDAAGNTNACSFTVTINDAEAPVIICPAPIMLSTDPGQCTRSNVVLNPTVTDNCGATNVCIPPSGSTFSNGVTTVTCVASDAAGNTNVCSFTVTINDTEAPVIICPTPMVGSTDPGQCTKSNVIFTATVTDNCGATNVCTPPSGSTFSNGVTLVTCVATDAAGNTNTCSFTVTINDAEAPVIICPAAMVGSTDLGQCTKSNVVFSPVVTDNCGATNVCTPPSGSTFSNGVTTVTCVASDAAGNTNACSFTVTINDAEAPVIICPAAMVGSTDLGQCTKSNVIFTATVTDNCGATNVCKPPSGSTFSNGVTLVTCVATDAAGNTNACSFSVTINDTEAPVIICPAPMVGSTDLGQCTKSNVMFTATVADNCGATNVCTPPSGSTFSNGVTIVTCVASDAAGNTNACSFTVTINDNEAPMITCPSLVLSTDPGQCTRSNVVLNPTVTDNCGATNICAPPSGSTFSKGVTTVRCIATDDAGNTNGCVFTVTINDTEPPAVVCSTNITVECAGPPGNVVTFGAMFSDNCPGVVGVCVPPSGSTFVLGSRVVTCTATDTTGNTNQCSFTVAVVDTIPPTIACPANIVAAESPRDSGFAPISFAVPVAHDICDSSVAVVCAPASGSFFPVGFTTVTCTATDDSGNTNACVFTVRVIPYRLFVVTVPNDSGPGSLRQAMLDANDGPGENRIEFRVLGTGPVVISVLSALPIMTGPVIIDGWTQPGFAGTPLVELDGSLSGGADGLVLTAGDSTVRGLALHGFAVGIRLATTGRNTVQGNFIGTDASGLAGPGNQGDGLFISTPNNLIGGSAGLGNVISGNGGNGVHFDTLRAHGNAVEGNYIGAGFGNAVPLGNHGNGIFLSNGATGNELGSPTNGAPNVIAFNGQSGVSLDALAGVRNAILANLIFSNNFLGIDLGADGVTLNDPADADEGPNRLQNFPVITDARTVYSVTTIEGTMSSPLSLTFRLEFFLNDSPDPSGYGEGQIFLGFAAVATHASNPQAFSVSFPVTATSLQFVTATATDPFGNTSEFSLARQVRTTPVLQAQPANTNTLPGAPVTLCATATGTPPFTWQWRLNGANILDATNACYTIPATEVTNGGTYTVVVENELGALTTIPALLSLPLPGVNGADNFVNRVHLVGPSGTVSGSNTFATFEAGEPRHARKPGGKSVWYTWTAADTGILTVGTTGSTFDTLLAVYTGSSVSNLTIVASDEDRGGFFTSGLRFNAIKGTTYQIAVDGYYGAEGTFVLSWSEEKTLRLLPLIVTQPQSLTVGPGSNVIFRVLAYPVCTNGVPNCDDPERYPPDDEPDLDYQWFFNGVPIDDATGSMLKIQNVQRTSVGVYTVQVTARYDHVSRTIESDDANLQINVTGSTVENVQSFDKLQDALSATPIVLGTGGALSASVSDDGSSFAPLAVAPAATVVRGYTGTQIFNTTNSSSQGEIFCGVAGGASRWVTLIAEKSGQLIVTTDGSTYDTLLAVFAASANPAVPTLLGCDNNSGSNGLTSKLTVPVSAGSTNFIGVDGVRGASGILQLNFSLCPDATMTPLGMNANGARHFQVNARSGLPLTIQISSNLVQWSSLLLTNAPSDLFDFVDSTTPPGGRRFYRAVICP